MRTTFSLVSIVLATVGFATTAVSQSDLQPTSRAASVDSMIEAYVQASGGAALAAVRSEVRTGTLVRGGTGKVPLEILSKAPGKWRYSQTFAWGDQIAYGFDGIAGWVQDTDGIEELPPEQLLDFQVLFDLHAPLKLREIFPEMSLVRSERVGDREAVTVRATAADGTTTELAFDRETGLLLRVGAIALEDYRAVGSGHRPFRILLGQDQGEEHLQMRIDFTEIRQNVDVDDAAFARPGCVLPVKDAPLHKQRTRVEVSEAALDACVGTYRHPQDSTVTYTINRQGTHLMFQRPGRSKIEIIPESEVDYFIEFLNAEFHFVKDATGKVTALEFGVDRQLRAPKIND